MKDVVILAGPNGAGKTTAAAKLLPTELRIIEFVNADEIARGLSPFNPEGSAIVAGRIMIERLRLLMHGGQSFAFETTLSGTSHLRMLRECREAGYRLSLIFLWLRSADLAIERVSRRIRQGGHSIPEDVIHRRYAAGIRNMRRLYLPLVDACSIYDNSDGVGTLIASREEGNELAIHDPVRWALIEEAAR